MDLDRRRCHALGLYGVVATFQSDDNFGRFLAAYGGIFVAGSIAWGMVADGYRPRPLRRHRRPGVPRGHGRDHVRAPQPLTYYRVRIAQRPQITE